MSSAMSPICSLFCTKHDIIYRQMNMPLSARLVTNSQRLMAHLDSTFCWLCSYFQYISLGKFTSGIWALQKLQDLNLDLPWPETGSVSSFPLLSNFPWIYDMIILSPDNLKLNLLAYCTLSTLMLHMSNTTQYFYTHILYLYNLCTPYYSCTSTT